MSKILKNTTISDISIKDTGVTIPASDQYIIPPQDYLLWAASEDIITHLDNEDIVVNDGVKDLSIKLGKAYLFDLDQRPKNVIRVSKDSAQNADFSTIKDALDFAVEGSVIIISPGTYVEDNSVAPLSLKTRVTVKSEGHSTVTIEPQDPNNDLFLLDDSNCRLQGVTIQNVTGASALKITSSPSPAILDVLTIINCQIPISVESTTTNTQAVLRNIRLISGSTTTKLLNITSSSGNDAIVRIYSGILTDDNGTAFQAGVHISGPGSRLDPNTLLLRSTVGVGTGVELSDGALLVGVTGYEISGFNIGIKTLNVGTAPSLFTFVFMFGNTTDLNIEHPTTNGDILGTFELDKIINNADQTLTLAYHDPVTGDLNSSRILSTRGFATELTNLPSFNSIHQLISFDPHTVVVTGSTVGTIVQLPDATTLRKGHEFWIINEASVSITVRQFDGSNPIVVTPSASSRYKLRNNSISAGVWSKSFATSAIFSGATTLLGFRNGNAGSGTYLEFFPGSASSESPFFIPNQTLLIALTIGASANSTGTIGIFRSTDLINPIASLSLNNEKNTFDTSLAILLQTQDELVARVTDGSISKPKLAIYLTGA